jgi:hypothetical protein
MAKTEVKNPRDTLAYWGGIRPLTKRLGRNQIIERNRDGIATELICIGVTKLTDFMTWDEDGKVRIKASRDIPEGAMKALKKIRVMTDKDGNNTLEIELYDKVAALRVLARAAGLLDTPEDDSDKPSVIGINMTGPEQVAEYKEVEDEPGECGNDEGGR